MSLVRPEVNVDNKALAYLPRSDAVSLGQCGASVGDKRSSCPYFVVNSQNEYVKSGCPSKFQAFGPHQRMLKLHEAWETTS